MSLHSWLQNLRSALTPGQRDRRRRASHRAATHRPQLEVLEDRSVPASSVWGDFNGDALPDLATANFLSNDVSIFLGTSDGPFLPAQNYPTYANGGPTCIAAGDFNGDGNLDLVTGNSDASISMFLGNGDGSFFWVNNSLSNMNAPLALAAADFNGDGNLDLAVSGFDTEWAYAGVDVILGSGNGMLGQILSMPIAGGYATDIEAADLNGDGKLDLWAYNEYSGIVTILLGNGDGTFQDAQDASPPSLRINDVTIVEGNTGAVAATFLVTLSKAGTETLTVAYAIADSGATAGSDYQAASGMLTFAPGETSKTITVLVNGDRLSEPNETFVVNLSSPTNATIGDGQGVGTVADDEPRISISDATKKEGNGKKTTLFVFTITLSAAYDQAVTMSFQTVNGTATTGGTDYVAKTGTLTFAPGETTKTITIEVKGDSKREGNEIFYLDLFDNSTNSQFTKSRGLGTILNDD